MRGCGGTSGCGMLGLKGAITLQNGHFSTCFPRFFYAFCADFGVHDADSDPFGGGDCERRLLVPSCWASSGRRSHSSRYGRDEWGTFPDARMSGLRAFHPRSPTARDRGHPR
jgi:hypothetical protein